MDTRIPLEVLPSSGVAAGSYGPSEDASPSHGASFEVPYLTVDAKGRVTAAFTKTITLPNASLDDQKVKQNLVGTSDTKKYPVLLKKTDTATDSPIDESNYAAAITVQPSTGTVEATKFKGSLDGSVTGNITGNVTGNASSATEFASNQTVKLEGDVTGEASSKAGWTVSTTLKNSGVAAGSYGPSANATPEYGATFNVPYITVDAKGRVTAASTKTVKIPASDNTDVKVTQTVSTENLELPLLAKDSNGTTTTTAGSKFAANVKVNPSTGTITATKFSGAVAGNASSATEFSAAKSVTLTGDVTGTASSKAGWTVETTLANSGVTAGTIGNNSQQTPAHGGTFNIPYVTVDSKGRVTAGGTTTVKLPADNNTWVGMTGATASANGTVGYINAVPPSDGYNTKYFRADGTWAVPTDNKVVQTVSTDNAELPLLAKDSNGTTTTTAGSKFAAAVKVNPSTGTLSATKFSGNGASLTALNGSQITSGTVDAARIGNLDASKITSGTIDIARLPAGALERCVVVNSEADRYALTKDVIQTGDTVKQKNSDNTYTMYFVVDDNNLDNASGYEVYTAGSATSVPWSGVTSKPTTISGYGITDAKIASGTITLGSNTITPLTSGSSLDASKLTGTASVNTTGNAATVTGTAGTSTLAWNSEVTLATIGGNAVKAKLPANPNTDTKVNVTLGTTTKAYLLGTSTTPTSTATGVTAISDTGVYLDTTAGKLTATSFAGDGQNVTNVVHLAGAETITGAKTITGDVLGINKTNSTDDANSLYSATAGSKLTYYTTTNGGTTLQNVPAAVNTTLESRTLRKLSDTDWTAEQICHNTNGLYYRKGTNSGWSAWKEFAFTNSNITGTAANVTGTVAVANGGTGLTASPSMLTNLGSTTAANVMQASPRPGVTGTLPVANGGTGQTSVANIQAGKDASGNTITTTYATKTELTNSFKGNTRVIEYIAGTQTAATGAFTGVTQDDALYDGKVIFYYLPYAGSGNATLELTLSGGGTTGAKVVYINNATRLTTHYSAGAAFPLVYRSSDDAWHGGDYWYDSNTYDRRLHNNNIKAAAAIAANTVIVGTSAGYKQAASGVTFDLAYPILWASAAISSGGTNAKAYEAISGASLQTTKSGWTGTQYAVAYLVGTLSGTTVTIDSSVFTTTIPATADGKVYIPLGVLYSTHQLYFAPTKDVYQYTNGSFHPYDATTVTAGTESLAWNTSTTIATINGTAIKAKIPANPNTDTKNTAGSTDTSSKIYLIGATSQDANPQTYSHDTAYVDTDGCLYSGGTKVLTAHQSLSNYVTLNGAQTISGAKTFTDNVTISSKTLLNPSSIEFKPASTTTNNGGYLDFHYNQSTDDYTSRIIESASGTLSINNVTITTGKVVTATSFVGALTGNASSATEFSAAKSVTLTGDVTGTASSKAGWSIATTLADSGVTAGTIGNNSQQTPAHGGTFNIPYVTVDSKGRVTAGGTTTVKLPADNNTDTLMTQNVSTTNATYPLLLCPTADAAANQGAKTGIFGSGVKVNPSTSVLSATGLTVGATGVTSSGNFTLTKSAPQFFFKDTRGVKGTAPSSNLWNQFFYVRDNNNVAYGGLEHGFKTTLENRMNMIVYKGTTNDTSANAQISVGFDSSGNWFTYAPTPATADNSTKMATTAFVKAQNYLTSSGVTAGTYPTVTVNSSGLVTAGPVKHAYTTAANAEKNWYRIANATNQLSTGPLYAEFLVFASNSAAGVGYYDSWRVHVEVWGQNSGIQVFGSGTLPLSSARILYENTAADVSTSTTPAIDLYLNAVTTTACNIEVIELYNSGWTFVANGALSASTVPTGYENRQQGPQANLNNNSNWTTHLYAGTSSGTAKAATTNGNTYLICLDNSTARDRVKLAGTGLVTVTSDASNNVTVNGQTSCIFAETAPTTVPTNLANGGLVIVG